MASRSRSPRLVVGNWKMNGGAGELAEAVRVNEAARGIGGVRIGMCPPATLLHRLSECFAGGPIATGGQDCHAAPAGAFTGDVSAEMLAEAGARFVILGHSERRSGHGETDDLVAAKARAAVAAGLEPIICVGETRAQHEAGETLAVIRRQLRGGLAATRQDDAFAIAYEPVWAIGSGQVATTAHIATVHDFIRSQLRALAFTDHVPILYGGSVSAASSGEIAGVDEVGGFLVGGASLKSDSFLPIILSAAEAVALAVG